MLYRSVGCSCVLQRNNKIIFILRKYSNFIKNIESYLKNEKFSTRHIGCNLENEVSMLETVGYKVSKF